MRISCINTEVKCTPSTRRYAPTNNKSKKSSNPSNSKNISSTKSKPKRKPSATSSPNYNKNYSYSTSTSSTSKDKSYHKITPLFVNHTLQLLKKMDLRLNPRTRRKPKANIIIIVRIQSVDRLSRARKCSLSTRKKAIFLN